MIRRSKRNEGNSGTGMTMAHPESKGTGSGCETKEHVRGGGTKGAVFPVRAMRDGWCESFQNKLFLPLWLRN